MRERKKITIIATSTKLVQTLHPEQRRTEEEEKSFCVPEMMREGEREKDITNEDNCIVVKTNTFALKKRSVEKYRTKVSIIIITDVAHCLCQKERDRVYYHINAADVSFLTFVRVVVVGKIVWLFRLSRIFSSLSRDREREIERESAGVRWS